MKLVGVLLLVAGLFSLICAAAIGLFVGPNWETAACSPVDDAKTEAERAADLLNYAKQDPSAKGTSMERGLKEVSDRRNRELKAALKNCDDAKSQRHLVSLSCLAAFVIGGTLTFLGIVALKRGQRNPSPA
jgi:hypothetical protein